jgi:hypothetical protein
MENPTKTSWPELVGVDGNEAVETIKKENPSLKVGIVKMNQPMTMDYRLDRVRVVVDNSNKVAQAPHCG